LDHRFACGEADFRLPEPVGRAILASKFPGTWPMSVEITAQSSHANPILVTGAAGAVGSIGRHVTETLLAKGHKVRALVRREDGRAEALRQLGAEVMQGDLTDLTAMHCAIAGCARIYFGMSVSPDYLTATVHRACGTPTNWRCRWGSAKPRRFGLSTWRAPYRSFSMIPRRTSARSTI
jgi:hypothetical protein